jgi:hypothetical protein
MRRLRCARRICLGVSIIVGVVFADIGLADAPQQRLQHPRGFVLVLREGLSASVTPTGFVVSLPDNRHRREPLAIAISIVPKPLPDGTQACRFWQPSLRCAWTREEGGGSSGEVVTLTIYAPLGDEHVSYRQVKYKDGFWPSFEAMDWLLSGELAVERTQ